ncbi:hypothetical protein I4F81_006607 [Pyropia yezoensis]|uniref:Uncharacterized protein n=1 Tax=Pyropia yezoensis TaxID=2788 RepID=A0ACC3C2M7_PYRYE|nr:hypothetical protein I4F81_006607 [Neopyropia yezoensis]
MAWGAAGSRVELSGASGREWSLTFGRALGAARGAVSVHVVDAVPGGGGGGGGGDAAPRQLVAKRVAVPAVDDVEPLVDEAATWRKASVASPLVLELVDVFVDRHPDAPSITFLSELATPHKAGNGKATPTTGAILGGFGPKRVAITAANPELSQADDVYDVGVLLGALAMGRAPGVVAAAMGGGELPEDLPPELSAALAAAVGPSSRPPDGLDAAVTRLTDGSARAGGADPRAYATVLSSVRDGGRGEDVFTALFRRPLSKDPVAALQSLTLVHRLLLEAGDDSLLGLVRHNDAFLAWAADSWSREKVEGVADPDAAHPLAYLFAGGEIADYSAFLRRKARFHMLAAFSFTGGWAVTPSGETSLTGRRRKVLTGVADLADSMAGLSSRLAAVGGEPREVARAAAATLAVEATGSLAAAVALVAGVDDTVTRAKMVDPFDRCYAGAREVLGAAAVGVPLLPPPVRALSLEPSPPDVTLEEVDTAAERAAAKEARRAARAAAKEQERIARAAEKEAAKAAKAAAKAGIKAAAAAAAAAEAEAKVDRSVGDLVGIGEERAPEAPPAPDRPAPGMSDIHALATAFGGGRPRNADGRGYLGLRAKAPASTALVVAGGQSMPGLRPHPAFCHCAGNKGAKASKAAPIVEVVVRRLRTGEKLGVGAFGEVFKGTYQDEPVAIKKLSATLANNAAAVEAFRAEVGVLFSLRHPHVLKVVAARTTPPDPMVLTEFMSRGTLFDVLHKARVAPTWPVYLAPEVLAAVAPHTPASDVYAYGVLMWELVARTPPYLGEDPHVVAGRVVDEGYRPPPAPNCLQLYRDLMVRCWAQAAAARPTFAQVVAVLAKAPG